MLTLTYLKPGIQGYIHADGNGILTPGLILYNVSSLFIIIIK